MNILRSLRRNRGMTQQQLAECVGCTQSQISWLELRKSGTVSSTLSAIANALGVNDRTRMALFNTYSVSPKDLSLLAQMRKRAGYTQSTLAEASGYSRSHVSQVELGYRRPSLTTLVSLADAMALSDTDRSLLFNAYNRMK